MSRKYRISDQERPYFVTFTVINWIDVFIRDEYRNIFLESVRYCQTNKGLEVHAWCMMTSHVHMYWVGQGAAPGRNYQRPEEFHLQKYKKSVRK